MTLFHTFKKRERFFCNLIKWTHIGGLFVINWDNATIFFLNDEFFVKIDINIKNTNKYLSNIIFLKNSSFVYDGTYTSQWSGYPTQAQTQILKNLNIYILSCLGVKFIIKENELYMFILLFIVTNHCASFTCIWFKIRRLYPNMYQIVIWMRRFIEFWRRCGAAKYSNLGNIRKRPFLAIKLLKQNLYDGKE